MGRDAAKVTDAKRTELGLDHEAAVREGLLSSFEAHDVTTYDGIIVLHYRETDGKPEIVFLNPDFERTILQIASDVPPTLRYRSLFLNQCNSFRYFIESVRHGTVITTWQLVGSPLLAKDYADGIIDGKTWKWIHDTLVSHEQNTGKPRGAFEVTTF